MRQRGPAIAVAAVVVVGAGVAAISQLASDEETVTGAAIERRLCNVTVPDIADDGVDVRVHGDAPGELVLIIEIDRGGPDQSSGVILDPETGETATDMVESRDRALFDSILGTVRVEPAPPRYWPYGEATQLPAKSFTYPGLLEYREPDPGAGLSTTLLQGYGGPVVVTIANCRSYLKIIGHFNESIEFEESVHPEDRAAFDALRATVRAP